MSIQVNQLERCFAPVREFHISPEAASIEALTMKKELNPEDKKNVAVWDRPSWAAAA
jgi:hypothetical protein